MLTLRTALITPLFLLTLTTRAWAQEELAPPPPPVPAQPSAQAAPPVAEPPPAVPVPQKEEIPLPVAPAEEQPRTLLSGGGARGGFGALRFAYTRVQGRAGALVGGRGAFLANHRFAIGLAGYGLASRMHAASGSDASGLGLGYGGLWLETVLWPMQVVHASVGALIGAGGVGYGRWSHNGDDSAWRRGSAFFVAEPTLAIEVNMTSFLRVGIEGGYRFVGASELDGVSDKDLSGWAVGTVLKFGKF